MESQQPGTSATPVTKTPLRHLMFALPLVGLICGIIGYLSYPYINNEQVKEVSIKTPGDNITNSTPTNDSNKQQDSAGEITKAPTSEPAFCAQYGTYEIKKTELFQSYTVGPGETLRQISKTLLNDETKAPDFIELNTNLIGYEIDEELPMGLKIYVPNDTYTSEEVTKYIRANGNIKFNSEKPMFGVQAPNSSTGPFIISQDIESDVKGIKEGDCVTVVYGVRGFASFVAFEVKKQ